MSEPTPRPWKVMYDSNIGPCIHDSEGIAVMGGDPDALAEAVRCVNSFEALVEALLDGGGIRDDGQWHGEACPGVPAFPCPCERKRAALRLAGAIE